MRRLAGVPAEGQFSGDSLDGTIPGTRTSTLTPSSSTMLVWTPSTVLANLSSSTDVAGQTTFPRIEPPPPPPELLASSLGDGIPGPRAGHQRAPSFDPAPRLRRLRRPTANDLAAGVDQLEQLARSVQGTMGDARCGLRGHGGRPGGRGRRHYQ